MIKGVLVVNNHGKPRLVKFFESLVRATQYLSFVLIDDLFRRSTRSRKSFARSSSLFRSAPTGYATSLRAAPSWVSTLARVGVR